MHKSTQPLPPNLMQIPANAHCNSDQVWFDLTLSVCVARPTAHKKVMVIPPIHVKSLKIGQVELASAEKYWQSLVNISKMHTMMFLQLQGQSHVREQD
jgi:hypothetical protein